VNAEAFIRLTDPRWIDLRRFFLASSITKQTSSTTKPHPFALGAQWLVPQFCPACPLPRWFWTLSDRLECWPSSHEVSPPIWTFSAVDGSITREHGSPSVRLYLFLPKSRSLNGAASALGLVSVFRYHPTLPPCIHFCHRLHLSSVSVPPSKSTFMCMKSVFVFVNSPAARCLHHHSPDNPKHRTRSSPTQTSLQHGELSWTHPSTLSRLLRLSQPLSPSLALWFAARLFCLCARLVFHVNSEHPSDGRRDLWTT
jgi:hypothetical protein